MSGVAVAAGEGARGGRGVLLASLGDAGMLLKLPRGLGARLGSVSWYLFRVSRHLVTSGLPSQASVRQRCLVCQANDELLGLG